MLHASFLLITSVALLSIGIYGLMTRRNAIRMFISSELVVNAGILAAMTTFIYLGHSLPAGEAFLLYSIVLVAAESAVGIALFLLIMKLFATPQLDEIRKIREELS